MRIALIKSMQTSNMSEYRGPVERGKDLRNLIPGSISHRVGSKTDISPRRCTLRL